MLLEEAGWEVEVLVGRVDDGELSPERNTAANWTTAMAWLKARAIAGMIEGDLVDLPILAGDTVCEQEGQLIGQPSDEVEAAAMLRSFRDASHRVWTGLCLLMPGQERRIGAESAEVHVGDLSETDIDAYVAAGTWRGKAGGYNLSDRIEAGWPIRYEGHPSTIMGLSLPLLERLLKGEPA